MRPMHSRALALLLAMVMVLSMIPVTAFAEGNATTWTKVDFSAITAEDTVAITMSKDGVTYVLPNIAEGSSGQPMAAVATVEAQKSGMGDSNRVERVDRVDGGGGDFGRKEHKESVGVDGEELKLGVEVE